MPDFNKSARTAKRIIDKNGRAVTFIKKSTLPADETKPWGEKRNLQETITTKCSFINYEVNEIDGEKIKVGDKKVLANAIDTKGQNLEDFEEIQDGGTTWRVKKVNTVQPADVVVMYEIQVRK